MATEIRTDPRLLNRLREASKLPITKAQLTSQRVSFIYGNLPKDSTITRDQIKSRLATIGGDPV